MCAAKFQYLLRWCRGFEVWIAHAKSANIKIFVIIWFSETTEACNKAYSSEEKCTEQVW